ncbi:hypothetical protein WJX79_001480 [Trebouxia sp. C0005]|nr:MAG: hypothetical protein FRX49_13207 [Trebouxia sp. A1-2]
MRSFTRLPFKVVAQYFSSRTFSAQAQLHQTNVSKPRWSVWSKALLAAPPTILAGWIVLSDEPQRRARVAYNVPLRVIRDALAVISIASDYKFSTSGLEGDTYAEALKQCHERSAFKLQKLCFANGGIYIKLGQHVAQLDYILPVEYVNTMRDYMLDKCPVSSYNDIAEVIEEDLGRKPEELFASIEQVPIASASLAQVHRAVSHDGRQLAVKVQHVGLRDTCAADTVIVEAFVKGLRWVFPDFNYQWLVDELKESVPKELDFKLEAANSRRCQANLNSKKSRVKGQVVVPAIEEGMVNHRVLVMEYVEGIKVTDRARIQELGFKPEKVAELVSRTFNEMVFIHGDVHCDPHAANLFLRKNPLDGGLQLVLLDHGLYRQISDSFRKSYALLWQSLIFADAEGIKEHSQAMNAGDMYPLFAGMLTNRPWDEVISKDIDHLYMSGDEEERKSIQETSQMFAAQITQLLFKVPRVLLLLLKTNDCLRSVDLALGEPVNTFVITARECSRALTDIRNREQPGIRSKVKGKIDEWHVEYRVTLLRVASWWALRWAKWVGKTPNNRRKMRERHSSKLAAPLSAIGGDTAVAHA